MADLVLSDLDDNLLDRFRARATLSGCSLEEELRQALAAVDPAEVPVVRFPDAAAMPTSTETIRWDRDTDLGRYWDMRTPGADLSPAEKLAIVDGIRALAPPGVAQTDSAHLIRQERERR